MKLWCLGAALAAVPLAAVQVRESQPVQSCNCACCVTQTSAEDPHWKHDVPGGQLFGCGPVFHSQPDPHQGFADCEPILKSEGHFCKRRSSSSVRNFWNMEHGESTLIDHSVFCFEECMPSTVVPKGAGRECIPVTDQILETMYPGSTIGGSTTLTVTLNATLSQDITTAVVTTTEAPLPCECTEVSNPSLDHKVPATCGDHFDNDPRPWCYVKMAAGCDPPQTASATLEGIGWRYCDGAGTSAWAADEGAEPAQGHGVSNLPQAVQTMDNVVDDSLGAVHHLVGLADVRRASLRRGKAAP